MAITAHNGEIYLLKGTPFNPNYDYSIYFDSLSAQQSYMESKVDVTLTAQNYVKTESGKIRVDKQEEHIRDCNYLMWKTPTIGSDPAAPSYTWMYAFITGIDYISNNVSEISYQIDVLQTYALFNVDFKYCFVKRMTPYEDEPGAHIEPEPINVDEFVYDNEHDFFDGDISTWHVILYSAYSRAEGLNIVSQGMAAGLPQGVVANVFETYEDFKTYMDQMAQSSNYETFINSIVGVIAMPDFSTTGHGGMLDPETNPERERTCIKYQSNITTVDGYLPMYKKLLTYPFNCLHITTGNETHDYPYEFFNNPITQEQDIIYFDQYNCFNPNPEIMVVPRNYRGIEHNFDETLSLNNLPQIPYGTSGYANWKSITSIKQQLMILGGTLKGISSGATFGKHDSFLNTGGEGGVTAGGLLGAAGGFVAGNISATAYNVYERIRGIPTHKSAGSMNGMTVAKALTFKTYQKCLRHDVAERIDLFFSRYGYAVNTIPKRSNGKYYAPLERGIPSGRNQLYIQTDHCIVRGRCAAEYCRRIEAIFDSGITWWRNENVIGDYN